MIRRFNYTGRARIREKHVRVSTYQKRGELHFQADLSGIREHYDFPLSSSVVVEAYRQTRWMRFPFGYVGTLRAPPETERALSEFDSPEGILFRVKVVEHGSSHRILGEADEVPILDESDARRGVSSLLSVKPQDLSQEAYRVDFSGTRPILLVNSRLGDYRQVARSEVFLSLVYPAVLREVLGRALVAEEFDDPTTPGSWQAMWLRYAAFVLGTGCPPQGAAGDARTDEEYEWIDSAVSRFAARVSAADLFTSYWDGESS